MARVAPNYTTISVWFLLHIDALRLSEGSHSSLVAKRAVKKMHRVDLLLLRPRVLHFVIISLHTCFSSVHFVAVAIGNEVARR